MVNLQKVVIFIYKGSKKCYFYRKSFFYQILDFLSLFLSQSIFFLFLCLFVNNAFSVSCVSQ